MALRLRYAIQMPKMATSNPPKPIAREMIVSEEGMIYLVCFKRLHSSRERRRAVEKGGDGENGVVGFVQVDGTRIIITTGDDSI